MKRLSDYKGVEAIELWADIFDDVSTITSDEEVRECTIGKNISIKDAAKVIFRKFPKESYNVLTRIDPEASINGANVFPGLVNFVMELTIGEDSRTFFKSAEQEISAEEPSGSATVNTEDGLK